MPDARDSLKKSPLMHPILGTIKTFPITVNLAFKVRTAPDSNLKPYILYGLIMGLLGCAAQYNGLH